MVLMTTDGIDRLGFLIHDSARLLRKRFETKGSAYGLSAAQWRLLVRLVKEEGVAQARLAELLEIEPISVSRLDPPSRRSLPAAPSSASLPAPPAIRFAPPLPMPAKLPANISLT